MNTNKITNYPDYSDELVSLVRAYDRASLLCTASFWHLDDLKTNYPHLFQDKYDLAPYTKERLELLEWCLPDMLKTINKQIKKESEPSLLVNINDSGELEVPVEIKNDLEKWNDFKHHFSFNTNDTEIENIINQYVDKYKIILFEKDELYIISKSIPSSFIEIWWRRWWFDNNKNKLYPLCLVCNEKYGWDCYGHER